MSIEINQIIRSNRKTIALVIQKDGVLIVRAPLKAPEKSIREFAEKNTQWILKKQAQVRAAVLLYPKQYILGETFLYLGREISLELVKGQKPALILDTHFKLADSALGNAGRVFECWYREQARQILSERVRFFASQHDLEFQGISNQFRPNALGFLQRQRQTEFFMALDPDSTRSCGLCCSSRIGTHARPQPLTAILETSGNNYAGLQGTQKMVAKERAKRDVVNSPFQSMCTV